MPSKLITSIALNIMTGMGHKSLRKLEQSSHNPMKENEALLFTILQRNKDTEFGRLHNFASINSIEAFRKELPISTYEDYEPYLMRIVDGEENILYKGKTLGFSLTSGSSGKPKYIPATQEALNAYTSYTWTRALALTADKMAAEGGKYKPGRGFYTASAMNGRTPKGLPCSNIAEIGASKFGKIFKYILTTPDGTCVPYKTGFMYFHYRYALEDENTSFLFTVFLGQVVNQLIFLEENWEILVDDIEHGTVTDKLELDPDERARLLKFAHPMPERAAYLRKQFEQGFDETLLKRLWPNMSFISGIGNAAYVPAARRVRKVAAGINFDFSIYGASEGLVAACYELENTNMQLLTDSCFFEFVPEEGSDEDAKTIDQLELGERYEVIITTQAGLYRYRLKDVIKVVAFRNKTPLIEFVHRKGQLINAVGEKFSMEDAATTMSLMEEKFGVTVNHWIMYLEYNEGMPHYRMILECDPGVDLTDRAPEIDEIMTSLNQRYLMVRATNDVGKLVVLMQEPGTHDAWREHRVAAGANGQWFKPVHTLDNEESTEFFMSRIIK